MVIKYHPKIRKKKFVSGFISAAKLGELMSAIRKRTGHFPHFLCLLCVFVFVSAPGENVKEGGKK